MDMDTDNHRLRCIFFSGSASRSLEQMGALARGIFPRDAEIIRCPGRDDLVRAVLAPGAAFRIVIICACNREELARLAADRSFLDGCEVIVILPDSDAATLRLGLKLYPRYMTAVPEDLTELGQVLQGMVRKSGHATQWVRTEGCDACSKSYKDTTHII